MLAVRRGRSSALARLPRSPGPVGPLSPRVEEPQNASAACRLVRGTPGGEERLLVRSGDYPRTGREAGGEAACGPLRLLWLSRNRSQCGPGWGEAASFDGCPGCPRAKDPNPPGRRGDARRPAASRGTGVASSRVQQSSPAVALAAACGGVSAQVERLDGRRWRVACGPVRLLALAARDRVRLRGEPVDPLSGADPRERCHCDGWRMHMAACGPCVCCGCICSRRPQSLRQVAASTRGVC